MRPPEVCRCSRYPSSSSAAISLRMVADETPIREFSTSVLELTGRPVATYSRTTSRRIIRCRSDTDASARVELRLEDWIVSSFTPCSWKEFSTLGWRVLARLVLRGSCWTSHRAYGRCGAGVGGVLDARSLASRWLQLVSHRGADHDVLPERVRRVRRGKREIGQG